VSSALNQSQMVSSGQQQHDDLLRSPHVVTKSHRVNVWRPFPEFAR
jgi:hypothetical protein